MSTAAPSPQMPTHHLGATHTNSHAIPRWRGITHTVTSLLVVVGYWLAAFGLPALLFWWSPEHAPEHATGHVHEAALGALLGVLLGGGALMQAWRPLERIAVTQHTLLASLGAAAAFVLAGRGTDVAGNAQIMLLLTAVLFAAHPAKRELARINGRAHPLLLGVAIPGGAALLIYAWIQGTRQLALGPDLPATLDGRAWLAEIAGAAIAIAIVAAVAGFGRPGWRLSAWSAALAAIVLATSWIAYPNDEGSLGAAAGATALLAASAFLTVTEIVARRQPSPENARSETQ